MFSKVKLNKKKLEDNATAPTYPWACGKCSSWLGIRMVVLRCKMRWWWQCWGGQGEWWWWSDKKQEKILKILRHGVRWRSWGWWCGSWGSWWGWWWLEYPQQVPLGVRHGLSRGQSLTKWIWNIPIPDEIFWPGEVLRNHACKIIDQTHPLYAWLKLF